ncbi:MAG TPA: VWA domain-containing protein [Vicinamibacterales bacterium]|jgi:VWFA-related protein|nr:VWA domain-containing protein [Vicinamibacterales bacterium]
MRMRTLTCGALVAALVLVAARWTHAQQGAATFQSSVEYVEVDVITTNPQGEFVRDLTKDDFQVTEDGKRQSIASFSLVDIPVEKAVKPLFTGQAIDPDVSSNERPFDGRIYVMVIDDLHTQPLGLQRTKAAARQFIEQYLGSNDLMAVVHTRGADTASQDFTSNKRLLLAAVDKTGGRAIESSVESRNEQANRTAGAVNVGLSPDRRDPLDLERASNARATFDLVRNIASWFTTVRGRKKSILLVSDGVDYDTNEVMDSAGSTNDFASTVRESMRDAIDAAMRSNVSIYGIDPRGLAGIDDLAMDYYNDGTILSGVMDPTMGQAGLVQQARLEADSLRVLSGETGGTPAVNRNNLASAYASIVHDNSSYYVLAYAPPTDKRDGKFHKIDVRVSRPGVVARARQGYVSPKGKAPAPVKLDPNGPSRGLSDALESPLPTGGLAMRVTVAPFKGTAPKSSVLVTAELSGRNLNLIPNDTIEFSFVAVDVRGKRVDGTSNKISMTALRPETKSRIEQSGLRVFNRVELPPGRYQMRIGAHDNGADTIGSVTYDLEIPDFYKLPFSMSGLALTSLATGGMVVVKQDDQMKGALPAPPVAERAFPQNDEIALFAEVYDNDTAPHKVDIETRLTSDAGKVVYKADEEHSSSELGGARGGYGYQARVPLGDVDPGLYVLTVEAKSRLGRDVGASRQVQITVTERRK